MRLALLFTLFLSACSNLEASRVTGDFYTWVDERGVAHTQKRKPTKQSDAALVNRAVTTNTSQPAKPKVKVKKNVIIQSDYTDSEYIDKKIAGDKLFSWTQDGRQIVAELNSNNTQAHPSDDKGRSFRFDRQYSGFREGRDVLLSDIFSRQIKLEDFFNASKVNDKDYILIEIDTIGLNRLTFNSFVKSNKVALPRINILQASYRSTATFTDIFDSYVEETWSSYGRFTGSLVIPELAKYILIRPSPALGVIETIDGDITLIDLGVIQITY